MMDQIRRHVNGGAQKVGSEVHVSADSFCDEESRIQGHSAVFESSLIKAALKDTTVVHSQLSLCVLNDCIAHNAEIALVHLRDVVVENAMLFGPWMLDGNARIPTGIWHRAPRYKLITGENGVSVGLTESTEGHALMACWRKPITKWLAFGPRLGIKHGWTAQQIEDARLFFQELLDVPIEGVIPSAT